VHTHRLSFPDLIAAPLVIGELFCPPAAASPADGNAAPAGADAMRASAVPDTAGAGETAVSAPEGGGGGEGTAAAGVPDAPPLKADTLRAGAADSATRGNAAGEVGGNLPRAGRRRSGMLVVGVCLAVGIAVAAAGAWLLLRRSVAKGGPRGDG
jgi:hypothetical protein